MCQSRCSLPWNWKIRLVRVARITIPSQRFPAVDKEWRGNTVSSQLCFLHSTGGEKLDKNGARHHAVDSSSTVIVKLRSIKTTLILINSFKPTQLLPSCGGSAPSSSSSAMKVMPLRTQHCLTSREATPPPKLLVMEVSTTSVINFSTPPFLDYAIAISLRWNVGP